MKKLLLALLLLPFTLQAQAQTIITIAGNGVHGYTGDGGAATSAEINNAPGVAADRWGNVYIADRDNEVIRKLTPAGIITTIAGGGTGIDAYTYSGPAVDCELNRPNGVAVDSSGNLYIVDQNDCLIDKIDTAGIITIIGGSDAIGYSGDGGPATMAQLFFPTAIAVDRHGNVYICDAQNYRVRKITAAGIITTIAGTGVSGYGGDGGPATASGVKFGNMEGIAVDPSGNVYVADETNSRVREITTSGTILTFAGNGTAGYSGDGGAANAAQLDGPYGVAADSLGNIYISDVGDVIRKVNTSYIISTMAGNGGSGFSGDGGPATAAVFNGNAGIAVSEYGVYVSDENNQRIRQIFNNHRPTFVNGRTQSLSICENASAVDIDTMLAVTDSNYFQTEHWSVATTASHGVLFAVYTATSDGGTLVPTSLSYTPFAGYSGSDVFTVVVSDGYVTDTTTINVTVNPLASAGTITGTYSVCPGGIVDLTDAATGGVWSSSTGTATVGSTGIVTGVSAGTAIISYTVSSCGVAYATKTVTIDPSPDAGSISGLSAVCPTSSITLSDAAGSGTWSSGSTGTATVGSSSGVVTGVTAGTALISYTVTNSCGSAYATETVTVNPSPSAGSILGSSIVCTGSSITLSDLISGGTWSSSSSGTATIGSATGVINGLASGTTTISYTVTNSCGTAYATEIVTVNVLASAGVITGSATVCVGSNDDLTDAVTGGVWSATNGSVLVSGSGVAHGFAVGVDTVIYTVTLVCSTTTTATATTVITVNPMPDAGSITGTDSVCIGDEVNLTDAAAGGSWTAANGNAFVSGSGLTAGVTAGTDIITYSVTNSCGTANATETITIKDCSTGVKEIQELGLLIVLYPNPAQNSITIASPAGINNVVISNLLGQQMFSGRYAASSATVNIAELPAGIYIARINETVVRKFIKD